jgi:AbrB family looped-hinge helix DNA binding protein
MGSKVWTTGHVVVPKPLRDAHGIHPGDEVEIFERDGDIVVRKANVTEEAGGRRSDR